MFARLILILNLYSFIIQSVATPVPSESHLLGTPSDLVQPSITQALGARADTTAPTDSSDLLTSIFNISVTDPTSKDLSNSVTTLHYQQTPSTSRKTKRATPRPVWDCPAGWFLRYSKCLRNIHPRAVVMECGTIRGSNLRRLIGANCTEDEVCIDAVPYDMGEGNLVYTAFCVATDNFVKIAKTRIGQQPPPITVAPPYKVSNTQEYSIDAVLTGLDQNSAVIASNLEIKAQTFDIFGNVQSWRSLANGTEQCNNCGSVAITPVPDGTQRFSINAVLQAGTPGALLYIASIML